MKTLTVIDTFGFFFRNYYALPQLKSTKGFPTGLLTGFINFIATLNKEHGTDYLVFALDSKERAIRKDIDPNYKANRPAPPEDLVKQLPVAIELIEKMGFPKVEIPRYEADDVIASLVDCAKEQGIKVKIVSHDKDLYQLIDDDRVVLYDPMKKVEINEAKCIEKFGVPPAQIVDYLALVGDASDNIPGVRGIGPKGATKLLKEFGSIENIYANLDKIANPRTRKLLEEGKENAFLSKKLATLYHDILPSCEIERYRFPDENPITRVADELLELDMKTLLQRAGATYQHTEDEKMCTQKPGFEAKLLDTKTKVLEEIAKIPKDTPVAFDTETDSLSPFEANIVGYSFAVNEEEAFYVPIAHSYLGVGKQLSKEDAKETLEKLMKYPIVGQNLKYDFAILRGNFGFENLKVYADTMIISWLLNPGESAGLDNMAKRHFSHEMVKFKDTVKKGENFSSVALEEACEYAAEDAWMTLKLYNTLWEKLDEKRKKVAKELEFPFVVTLLDMEEAGIKIDQPFFRELKSEADETIAALTHDIYALAGKEFNINSTQQLGKILFDDLGLKAGKKTKTGYSTNEQVLQDLYEAHPIIPKILEYREIYKLRSTYIEPLLKLAKKAPDGRIHTSFLQTGTATGRLSSKNPNLQNIPVRSEIGRRIREGFIAAEGYKLIGIDYSQMELRLLAHYSKDPALIEAFREGKDIHAETAAKIFGPENAQKMRPVAKSINFGLLYGMGSRKLAQTIHVSPSEAKSFIEKYFASFPTVKAYLESIKAFAKEHGYVETLLGRRRYFDYENANAFAKASFERESVNTVFQGSAADIIKLAMQRLHDSETDKKEKVMLLQIHDELIFEVREDLAEAFAAKAKTVMENIYTLEVPLECTVAIGNNWGELK
ncbi:MAG: DNA polymerase I [Sulfurospirillum sp.]|nr:MAG: DNA polymerase I [Sulfurospirillum sp.]